MIEKDIREYAKQFAYEPEVENVEKLGTYDAYVIGGMGGSGLVAGILRRVAPTLDIAAHHEYGLPKFLKGEKQSRLFIAISHSGNTEETLDFCETAVDGGHDTAVIASGGKLLAFAKEKGLPYVDVPAGGIQPRMALGYVLRAVPKLIGEAKLYEEAGKLADTLDAESLEDGGRALAEKLEGTIPVIYASRDNHLLAFNWKIKFNETGKIPAFYNTFPELNHNEMAGFDVQELSKKLHFVFLKDNADHPRIKIRMEETKKMYEERGLPVEEIEVKGKNKLENIFSTLSFGDWTALYLSKHYGTEPEKVPMIEEFKKRIA